MKPAGSRRSVRAAHARAAHAAAESAPARAPSTVKGKSAPKPRAQTSVVKEAPKPPTAKEQKTQDARLAHARMFYTAEQAAAFTHMMTTGASAYSIEKSKKFDGVTANWLNTAKTRPTTWAPEQGNSLLTHQETKDLVTWVGTMGLAMEPKHRGEIETQVLRILRARALALKKCRWRRGTPLSNAAKKALHKKKVSDMWFRTFDNKNVIAKGSGRCRSDGMQLKTTDGAKVKAVDSKRAYKATFNNAQKISKSLYKELTELPDRDGVTTVGTVHPRTGKVIRPIIDPATGACLPPPSAYYNSTRVVWRDHDAWHARTCAVFGGKFRFELFIDNVSFDFALHEGEFTAGGRRRLLQIDEVGSMISYDGRRCKKVYTAAEGAAKTLEDVNRTSFSGMPCCDVEGYLYDFQVLFASAGLNQGHLPDSDELGSGQNYCFQHSAFSKSCFLSSTAKGMQTGASLRDRYVHLTSELRAREVRGELEFPVVVATDGHSSRTGAPRGAALCMRTICSLISRKMGQNGPLVREIRPDPPCPWALLLQQIRL